MRHRWWRIALLGLLFAPRLFGTACAVDTLANYVLLGATGCTIATGSEQVVVNDFAFSVAAMSVGLTPLTSAQITVTPAFTGSKWQVFFTSGGFFVSGSQFVKYDIGFNWDPVVVGAEDELNANTPVPPGTATVTTDLCNGQIFGGALCPTTASPTNVLKVFSDGIPADAIPLAYSPLVPQPDVNPGIIGVFNLLDLEANGQSSEITGFADDLVTPEPATWLLVMAAGVALARRRLRRLPAAQLRA